MKSDKGQNNHIALFKGKAIRRTLHNKEWWFSIIDVVGVLTDSPQPKTYWAKMKEREIGLIKFDAGYGYSDIKSSKGDVHYFYTTVEFRELLYKVTPYLSLELDLPVKKELLEGGFMYLIGGKYPIKISEQIIDIDLSLAGHDGIYGYRPEKLSSARLSLSTLFKLGCLELTPELNFQKRLGYSSENGEIAKDRIYGGLKMALPFNIL